MWVVCIERPKKSTLIMRFTAIVNYNLQKKLAMGHQYSIHFHLDCM